VTGKLCGETISSWAWDTHAMVATSLGSLMRLAGKRVFFVSLDSAVGRLLEGDATQIIQAAGGTVLGSVKHPLNTVDFSSFLLQAQAAHPDIIVFANAGNDTVNAIKQSGEFGLTSGANPIAVARRTYRRKRSDQTVEKLLRHRAIHIWGRLALRLAVTISLIKPIRTQTTERDDDPAPAATSIVKLKQR
jgi:hypothetical protein